ncbi:MAG: hypothetical protein GX557_10470 [Chloroflexi bacterium]|nr:hypothetical protein [Chloroflexota bacterium]
MHPHKRLAWWIIVLGGLAVVGGYVLWLALNPGSGDALWGGVPDGLRPLFTAGMLAAAVGYLILVYLLLFRLDPATLRIGGRPAYPILNALLVGFLLPSALWMPFTLALLAQPSAWLWVLVRLVLALVALSGVGLVIALLALRPRPRGTLYWLGVAGAVLFTLHTLVIDALIWPAYFPKTW